MSAASSSTAHTALAVVGGVAATALVAWPVFIWWEVRRLEKPKYRVLKTLEPTGRFVPPVEVRQYDPFLVAEVTFSKAEAPEMKTALSNGFRAIAGYIFDSKGEGQKEEGKEKIAMTSPVTAEMGDDGYKVAFVMPSKYTEANIPKPANAKVEIKSVGAHTLAALSFRGKSPREPDVESRKQQLLALLKKHDISVPEAAATRVYQYHPPFAPNWMRLNEVLLPVDFSPNAAS
jgi:hypothetical protein